MLPHPINLHFQKEMVQLMFLVESGHGLHSHPLLKKQISQLFLGISSFVRLHSWTEKNNLLTDIDPAALLSQSSTKGRTHSS